MRGDHQRSRFLVIGQQLCEPCYIPRSQLRGQAMKSPKRTRSLVVKRSIVIAGHKTSVSLENDFWEALREIANKRRIFVQDLVASIKAERRKGNLSSAIRLFVLDHYLEQLQHGKRRTPSA
jgi:predicted DNA-binding ribbon-helix-helix protein